MSIMDAKDPASWQIGFEDGIKFAVKANILGASNYCEHLWEQHPVNEYFMYCVHCKMEKGKR